MRSESARAFHVLTHLYFSPAKPSEKLRQSPPQGLTEKLEQRGQFCNSEKLGQTIKRQG